MPLLELRAVSASYGHNRVLHDVDLTLDQGEIVTLIGSNGAGKSTLVKTISGLMRCAAGDVLLNGQSIARLSPSDRLRQGIAHVPEGRQIFAGMTVEENLALGAYATRTSARAEEMTDLWKLFPVLRDRLSDTAGNFSGGQQQMLAIARGLMSAPKILLLDEPSLGIAPLLVAEIFKLIQTLRDRGLTILLAEQNAKQALAIADRGYVFENGRVVLSGSSSTLMGSSEVAERYLGVGHVTAGPDAGNTTLAARLRSALDLEV